MQKLTRIYSTETFVDYPLKAANSQFGLGIAEATKCVLIYVGTAVKPIRPEKIFEAWVVNRFTIRLFEIFFDS